MAEKLYSYADKQVMDEVGSSGGGGSGSGSVKIINTIEDGRAIDASYNELKAALLANEIVIVTVGFENNVTRLMLGDLIEHNPTNFSAVFVGANSNAEYESESADEPMTIIVP